MSNKFVVDANVVISSLICEGVASSVFSINSILNKFKFIAPEFLLEEVKKHKSKALKLTKFSEQEFKEAYEFLINEITFIPAEQFSNFLPKAKQLAPHDKDASYIALSIAVNCPIFSGDKGLLNSKANVISPRELFDSLSSP
ncbi:MAG: hypothetical protein KJ905_01705 [Nanoarchaeota archaeon]|nr:hypothetical protein [Nanoarchaeota archaeon]MBU1501469.1 hypothetical protein [Nanoarchaeota archaeon]